MFFRAGKTNKFSVFHVESQNYLIQDSFISFDTNIWLLWFRERVKKLTPLFGQKFIFFGPFYAGRNSAGLRKLRAGVKRADKVVVFNLFRPKHRGIDGSTTLKNRNTMSHFAPIFPKKTQKNTCAKEQNWREREREREMEFIHPEFTWRKLYINIKSI